MKINNKYLFSFFVTIVIFLSLFFLHRVDEMERGVYSAFCNTFLRDGDLNIFNHITVPSRWLVTRSYNIPSVENHGSVIFWTPFYLFSFLFPRTWGALPLFGLSSYELIALFRNSLFFVIAIYFLLRSARTLEISFPSCKQSRLVKFLLIFSFVFGSPTYLYLFFEPFCSEVTTFFLSSIIISHFIFLCFVRSNKIDWFFSGLLVGMAGVFKVSFFSFLGLYILLAINLGENGKWFTKTLFRLLILFLGYFIIIILQTINFSIQMGEFTYSTHFEALNFIRSDRSFGYLNSIGVPNGGLVASPIVLLIIFIACYLLALSWKSFFNHQNKRNIDFITFSFSLLILGNTCSLFLMAGHLPVYPDQFSSRVFLNLVPPGYILAVLIKNYFTKSKWFLNFLFILITICMLVNFLHLASYLKFAHMFNNEISIDVLLNLIRPGENWKKGSSLEVLLFLITCFVLSYFTCLIFQKIKLYKIFNFRIVIAAFGLFYLFITTLNLINNPKKVASLKKDGEFLAVVVSGGKKLNYYDELTSNLETGIEGHKKEMSDVARRMLEKYTLEASKEPLVDPIGFQKDREKGIIRGSLDFSGQSFRWIPGWDD